MALSKMFRWFGRSAQRRPVARSTPQVTRLEARDVPAGYVALGAGAGGLPAVTIRVDIQDALGGSAPTNLGQPAVPRSDGKTDFTSQTFFPFATSFRGGVKVATANVDGLYATPDQLITAAGPGGGPHVIVWNTRQNQDGSIVVDGIRDQFFAYDPRFRGGVTVTAGDLDGDGAAEIITGAGPGGGPHVRVWKEVGGRFRVVNEFFAFDAGFRGGVNVASGQGYRTLVQQRLVLSEELPDGFQVTPYNDPTLIPGSTLGVPLVGLDSTVPAGGSVGFGPNGGYIAPVGVTGHVDEATNRTLNYFTVASGSLQLSAANLLNAWGNVAYGPAVNPVPDAPEIGSIVFAKWAPDSPNFPGAPFQFDVDYGPFRYMGTVRVADADVPVLSRLLQVPEQVNFKNQLVIGAGPGGGPHVKVYDFSGTVGGGLINNGVGKEFFAFDASFRGGVTVAINDTIQHPDPTSRSPGRIDFTQDPPVFIPDASQNSGTQVFSGFPYNTELNRRYQAEVIVGMQSQGSEIRMFADVNPAVPSGQPFVSPAPATRTSLAQVNLQPFFIDTVTGINPNNPLGGYTGTTVSGSFRRGVENNGTYTGGVNLAIGSLYFNGSSETQFKGGHTLPPLQASNRPVNPTLGQLIVAANGQNASPGLSGSRVRIFDSVGPYLPNQATQGGVYDDSYGPNDDFQAFPADPFIRGASVAFGYGVLPEPGINVQYITTSGANGYITSNEATLFAIQSVTDAILLPGG